MFTQGEWTRGSHNDEPFARSEFKIFRDDGRCIVEIKREGFMPIEEAEADAYLIAQSPRMAEWIAKVARQDFTTFPEDRVVAKEIIQTLDLS